MTIASRTPEGDPHLCPICGELAATEPSEPLGDSTCPRCGALLVEVRDILQAVIGRTLDRLSLDAKLSDELGLDSLDVAELVMLLEEEFGSERVGDDLERVETVADLLRKLHELRRDQGLED